MNISQEEVNHFDKGTFEKALQALDEEIGKDEFIIAFAPIRMISAGGYLALSLLRNQLSTSDIDYIIDPEWATDDDIREPIRKGITAVADSLKLPKNWLNDDMHIFVTDEGRERLFKQAQEQGIYLFRGTNVEILAAPLKWALERKMRRVHYKNRGRKSEPDLCDCLGLLKYLKEQAGSELDREEIRTLNLNGFDVLPDQHTMSAIAAAYREKYGEEIFKAW
ncbi:hypothetical protein FQN57_002406 [Myotisia sp. PD_48]|nr:hypothetical protein FQN57_002406 [Myotisia sp. PD_48]